MTPVTRANAPESPSLQISQTTAASLSSLSANTQANINEGNNSFKRMDCTSPNAISSTSQAVSTSLSTAPWPSSSITLLPFSPPSGTYSPSFTHSCPPHHPPDHMTSTSGIPVPSTTQPSSAMLHPPWHLPHHVTLTLAVPVTLTLEQQASVT